MFSSEIYSKQAKFPVEIFGVNNNEIKNAKISLLYEKVPYKLLIIQIKR